MLRVAIVPLCSMTTTSLMIISRIVYLGLEWVLEWSDSKQHAHWRCFTGGSTWSPSGIGILTEFFTWEFWIISVFKQHILELKMFLDILYQVTAYSNHSTCE